LLSHGHNSTNAVLATKYANNKQLIQRKHGRTINWRADDICLTYFICKSFQLTTLIGATAQVNTRTQQQFANNKWWNRVNQKRMLLMEEM
jgi:hypothetical protein